MKRLTLVLITALITAPGNLRADGLQHETRGVPVAGADPTPNQASDASFDKRLPPVLPGEEIGDSGKKMKMWSTSGAVPVSNAPEPFHTPVKVGERAFPAEAGVIIDQRKNSQK